MLDVTYKLEAAKTHQPSEITWVKLKGDSGSEWVVDSERPGVPEGLVALQHWCSGSYRWVSLEALNEILK